MVTQVDGGNDSTAELRDTAVQVCDVEHRYGDRQALGGVRFSVHQGEIFGLLGPNGGGKSTLFRLMATLLPLQTGSITVLGCDVATQPAAVRSQIGVTFQSPSVDGKLTVGENLRHQAHLYGLSGRVATDRIDCLVEQFRLQALVRQRVDTLSGGLKRRVEIAKSLLHSPELLLLDEPSTGLDPGARHDLWQYLERLSHEQQVTILVTTHLMDEAEHCGRLAILDRGCLVTLGTPAALRQTVGGDCLKVSCPDPEQLARQVTEHFGLVPRVVDRELRIEHAAGHEFLRDLVAAFPDAIQSVVLSKPTLEDVFIAQTGHRFWDEVSEEAR
ncbi:MAG: ABC transporter ATP-binding protein [Planctomycetes bacterium]|nr:ABC transporter ATP-binding protein [Planctomycetota bacterium]